MLSWPSLEMKKCQTACTKLKCSILIYNFRGRGFEFVAHGFSVNLYSQYFDRLVSELEVFYRSTFTFANCFCFSLISSISSIRARTRSSFRLIYFLQFASLILFSLFRPSSETQGQLVGAVFSPILTFSRAQ